MYINNNKNLFHNTIIINLSKLVISNTNILNTNINLNKIDFKKNFLFNNNSNLETCKYCNKTIYKHFDAILDLSLIHISEPTRPY